VTYQPWLTCNTTKSIMGPWRRYGLRRPRGDGVPVGSVTPKPTKY